MFLTTAHFVQQRIFAQTAIGLTRNKLDLFHADLRRDTYSDRNKQNLTELNWLRILCEMN